MGLLHTPVIKRAIPSIPAMGKFLMVPWVHNGTGIIKDDYVKWQFDPGDDDELVLNFGTIPEWVNLNVNPTLYWIVDAQNTVDGVYDILLEPSYTEDGEDSGAASESHQDTYIPPSGIRESKTYSKELDASEMAHGDFITLVFQRLGLSSAADTQTGRMFPKHFWIEFDINQS